jgi:hypothetical protein
VKTRSKDNYLSIGFLRISTVVDGCLYTDNGVGYIIKTMKSYIVKLKQVALMTGIALSGIGASGAVTPATALTFNFAPAQGMSQQAIDGFAAAGNLWSSLFTDNVTVNININFSALSPGVLGQTGSTQQIFSYSQVYNALNNDKSSADDNIAVNSLSKNSTFNMLLNRTSNSPKGYGSATPYLDKDGDANNSKIRMNTANAKALGLRGNSGNDASISFSNLFSWDFNRSNGITAGTFDFVGIAAHEIGHALGFISGVDILDYNSSSAYYRDDQFTYVSPLDLFRYSTDSKNLGAIDWTADARDKYFSLDRGLTKIAAFSTGEIHGDGRQASHWKDNLGLGIMDPTSAPGEFLQITENDKRAFDAIGWNRAIGTSISSSLSTAVVGNSDGILGVNSSNTATAVPEPANFIGTFICAAFGVKMVLKRRQKLSESIETATEEV